MKPCIIVTILMALALALPLHAGWVTKNPMPVAAENFASGVIGNAIYLAGGWGSRGPLNTCYRYTPASGQWVQRETMNTHRAGMGTGGTAIGSKLEAIAGVNSGVGADRCVEEYDTLSNTWIFKESIPENAAWFATGTVGGKVYCACLLGNGRTREFDPATNAWALKNSDPENRWEPCALAYGGEVYVIGGYISGGPIATVNKYNPSSDIWTTRLAQMPTARYGARAVVLDGRIYVIGGSVDFYVPSNVVEIYDPASDTWVTGDPMQFDRYGLAAEVVDGRIYAIGGEGSDGLTSTVEEYTPTQPLPATVQVDPRELNLRSRGRCVTCYTELPEGYSVNDIDPSTVALSAIDGQPLDPPLYREGPFTVGDYDHDDIADLMVKFDRQTLIGILRDWGYGDGDEPELAVTGRIGANTTFNGVDTIGLIENPGGGQGQSADAPKHFSVKQCSPSPFRAVTSVRYGLPAEARVRLSVYGPDGRRVATLVDGLQGAGYHSARWNGKDELGRELQAGVYFLRLEAGSSQASRKAQLLR